LRSHKKVARQRLGKNKLQNQKGKLNFGQSQFHEKTSITHPSKFWGGGKGNPVRKLREKHQISVWAGDACELELRTVTMQKKEKENREGG